MPIDVSSLTKLFAHLPDVIFTEEGIQFQEYPFAPSTIYPSQLLVVADIEEINEKAAPPEIRTRNGDILFISAVQKDDLLKFAKQNKLPVIYRFDIWDRLLEPFLDTEFGDEEKKRTLRILEQNGISEKECETIREEVSRAMIPYNFATGLWDWAHLGLKDLLSALRGILSEADFQRYYWYTMEIAFRAQEFDKES